jgi:hypothetical protein
MDPSPGDFACRLPLRAASAEHLRGQHLQSTPPPQLWLPNSSSSELSIVVAMSSANARREGIVPISACFCGMVARRALALACVVAKKLKEKKE